MAKKRLPDQAELIRLHDVEGLTNKQIAEMFDANPAYISRKRTHGQTHIRRDVWIDPRNVLPLYAPYITDETAQAWRVKHQCLCGCGERVGIRTNPNRQLGLQAGHPLFFKRGHNRSILPETLRTGHRRSSDTIRRTSATRIKRHSIPVYGISCVLDDYLKKTNKSIKQFAAEIECSPTWLAEVRSCKTRSILKVTAVRLLTAMGESVPGDLLRSVHELQEGKRTTNQSATA
jgi:hypothetical protein